MTAYHRLVSGRKSTGPVRWYLADDHLLVADRQLYIAHYRRFYFADLRSVTLFPNRRLWVRMSVVLGSAALIAIPLAYFHFFEGAAITFGVAALFAILDFAFGRNLNLRVITVHSTYTAPLRLRERWALGLLERLAPFLPSPTGEDLP